MATAILMPRQGQSVESCILVEWLVKPGDSVEEGTPLANIETDKATFEIESPASGTVVELFFEEGDDVPVLMHIGAIGEAGEDVSSLKPDGASSGTEEATPAEAAAEPAKEEAAPAPTTQAASVASGVGVSPRARKAAAEKGVDTQGMAGSGPAGRVIERDVLAASASQPRMTGAAQAAIAAGCGRAPTQGSGPGGMILSSDLQSGAPAPQAAASVLENKEIPVTGIRKIVAQRMHASLSQTAQLTLNRSVNATSMQEFRKKVKKQGEALGLPNITFNDMIVFATAQTLKKHPELNAHFLGEKIVQFGNVHIGIAVDTPRGLMVPVLKGVESMSLSGVSRGIKPLAESCIAGSPNPDDLSGGSFTITNLGSMGIETFTPVLNAPEVAILGVGGLTLKPVKTESGVEYADFLSLSLTIDHQAVDGASGARFLVDLAAMLENFELALA